MPRKTKNPLVYLALSPTAFDIAPRHIYQAITLGHLDAPLR
jgi:hypothetical protein